MTILSKTSGTRIVLPISFDEQVGIPAVSRRVYVETATRHETERF